MPTVVRLGPVPLQLRRASRIAELERIFGTAVELVEVTTAVELLGVLATPGVIGVAIDAAASGELTDAIAAAGRSLCYERCSGGSATPAARSTSCSTGMGCSAERTSAGSPMGSCPSRDESSRPLPHYRTSVRQMNYPFR